MMCACAVRLVATHRVLRRVPSRAVPRLRPTCLSSGEIPKTKWSDTRVCVCLSPLYACRTVVPVLEECVCQVRDERPIQCDARAGGIGAGIVVTS